MRYTLDNSEYQKILKIELINDFVTVGLISLLSISEEERLEHDQSSRKRTLEFFEDRIEGIKAILTRPQ